MINKENALDANRYALTQCVSTAPQLKSDLDKSQQLNDLKTIRAPVSGYIQKIEVTTLGQVVTLGHLPRNTEIPNYRNPAPFCLLFKGSPREGLIYSLEG